MRNRWVVQLLGSLEEDKCSFCDEECECGIEEPEIELSVVKEGHHGHFDDKTGRGSWGWADDEKIILLGGYHYSQETVDRVKRLAESLAEELNGERQHA